MSATHTPHDDPQIILYPDSNRPASIDLSLELERQLEAESLPNSPNPPRPQSLDPHGLASIVTQLRFSLAEVTKERDALVDKVSEAQTREEGMRETLEHVTEKCIRMENDLEVAANQRKEDEETIAMLRSKVEESRYVSACSFLRAHTTIPALFADGRDCIRTSQTRFDETANREADEPSIQSDPRFVEASPCSCLAERASFVKARVVCAIDRFVGRSHEPPQDILCLRLCLLVVTPA